ncbi:trypsin-like peptidase domain-containing protein [Ornithinibacillus scapharcae]|uniref:trypsin-like peptidase domain-containing protein n=1 Tax=Ornithinibacillus scapharcae TaxID=1147159 RepID=UPI000225AD63|nr:trypsin-like peptidase domain-containing protein [Ornithinibacillus scapharcae]
MYCHSCGGERRPNSIYCPHCGTKQKNNTKLSPFTVVFLSLLLVGTIVGSILIVVNFYSDVSNMLASDTETNELKEEPEVLETTSPVLEKQNLQEEQKQELTEIIATAQETVYTVFTPFSQGSGFLYNKNGAVVTNAHVVEGATEVSIKTISGVEYPGTVIGYSNETDIAVVQVPDLIGKEPFPLELSDSTKIGEEIIALGSPLGLENTATMGYVTGKNRNFVIDPYVYENLYQISAPISPGSSGGPLISKTSEKIIAINSAESIEDASIGFSIPLYTVHSLIDSWINQPMNEEEILALFSNTTDISGEGYFDGGEYAEDEDYYNYWEYGYEDFWSEFGDALWEYMAEDSYYEQWYSEENGNSYENHDSNADNNIYFDEETGEWSYYDEATDRWFYYDDDLDAWTFFNELDGLWYYFDENSEEFLPY